MVSETTRMPAVRSGGIDWAEHWRATVEARPGEFRAGGSRWEARAERFTRLARSLDAANDPFVRALKETLRPTDTVLDVGAGAGRYSLPIADEAARITAVEPGAGMRASFAEEIERRGITNVTIVPGSWEEAQVDVHDVAFVANVLYFVADAVAFVDKLDRHARRACFILHRAEERAAGLMPLWEEIWGYPRPPEPSAVDLFNLLFAVGIRPNFRLIPRPAPVRFEKSEDAMREARQSLELDGDDRTHDERIAAFLRTAVAKRDGLWEFPSGPQMAIISWEKS